jgi:hypothetical protein
VHQRSAGVLGVVIAGVLATFIQPGIFALDSTLVGALLLGVLAGYGEAPTSLRQVLGFAVALAFCALLIIGFLVDDLVGLTSDEHVPGNKHLAGWQTLVTWLFLLFIAYAWVHRRYDRKRHPLWPEDAGS